MKMRRAVVMVIAFVTLMASSIISVPVGAQLGGVDVVLTCSDGIEMTDTVLVVDTQTLAALQSAVEAMTLYPAGLVCRLTQAPLLTGSLLGRLIGPRVAFAQGNPRKDFVVGGFRVSNCRNFAVSAHSDGVTTKGSFTQNQPQPSVAPGCYPTPGGGTAKVTCLSVEGNVARINAVFQNTHGSISVFTHVMAAFADNPNLVPGMPADTQHIQETNTVLPTTPPCNTLVPQFPISNGNISVNDAGATAP